MKAHVLQTIADLEAEQTVLEHLSNTAKRPEARDSYSRRAIRLGGMILDLKEVFTERKTFGTVQALPNIDIKKRG